MLIGIIVILDALELLLVKNQAFNVLKEADKKRHARQLTTAENSLSIYEALGKDLFIGLYIKNFEEIKVLILVTVVDNDIAETNND